MKDQNSQNFHKTLCIHLNTFKMFTLVDERIKPSLSAYVLKIRMALHAAPAVTGNLPAPYSFSIYFFCIACCKGIIISRIDGSAAGEVRREKICSHSVRLQ